MCGDEDCGCHGEHHERHHAECGGGHHGYWTECDFPLMSVEEEVEALEGAKSDLEKRLEIVNKRLEVLKR